MTSQLKPIQWREGALRLLDQRQLPHHETYIDCVSSDEVADAIVSMAVRGAPAIGICAAYAMALTAQAGGDLDAADAALRASRPTAVNLRWALDRVARCRSEGGGAEAIENLAVSIHHEDAARNRALAGHALTLLPERARVLTHCNTGVLATGGHGTALGVVRSAQAAGRLEAVYATETRPWLQGARLTAWELMRDGIDVQLLADGAAAGLMASGAVDWVIVGADRIAANGDVANKVGTLALACAAARFDVGMMVCAPLSTFDASCPSGADIPIETRDGDELTHIAGQPIAPAAVSAYNPVFDVTPAELISAVVCEHGVARAPNGRTIAALLGRAAMPFDQSGCAPA